MYAIIETDGTQLRVSEGDTIKIQRLSEGPGGKVILDKVLLVGGEETLIGSPYLENVTVELEVASEGLSEKVLVFKKKRRTKYRLLNGARQPYSEVTIKKINIS